MQVFGLPRHVIRAGGGCVTDGGAAFESEAAVGQDAVARRLGLRSHGLTGEQAARGVGARPLEALPLAERGRA